MLDFSYLRSRDCMWRNLSFLVSMFRNDTNFPLIRRNNFDLDIGSIHGLAFRFSARPVNVENGLKYIR